MVSATSEYRSFKKMKRRFYSAKRKIQQLRNDLINTYGADFDKVWRRKGYESKIWKEMGHAEFWTNPFTHKKAWDRAGYPIISPISESKTYGNLKSLVRKKPFDKSSKLQKNIINELKRVDEVI
jgi:hypothetical protein